MEPCRTGVGVDREVPAPNRARGSLRGSVARVWRGRQPLLGRQRMGGRMGDDRER